MRTPLLAGRRFTPDELQAEMTGTAPIMVNRSLADQMFGTLDVVGRTLPVQTSLPNQPPRYSDRLIVGVTENSRVWNLDKAPEPLIIEPLQESWQGWFFLIVRASASVDAASQAVRNVLSGLDSSLPLATAEPMEQILDRRLAEDRLMTGILGAMALLAALLAVIGLYGVVSHSVTERTREIGIRMVAGATQDSILRLVMANGYGLIVLGILLGVVGGGALGELLESRLFGVTALSPPTFLIASGAFLAIATLATWLPARSAARVDPVQALRHE